MAKVVTDRLGDVILARLSLGPIEVPDGPYFEDDLRHRLELTGHEGELSGVIGQLEREGRITIEPTGKTAYGEEVIDFSPSTGPILEVREVHRTTHYYDVVRISIPAV